MVPPFVDENDPMYYLQLSGEVAYKWREVYWKPRTAFQLLQRSILPLGYQLMESAEERVGPESNRREHKAILDELDNRVRQPNGCFK